MDTKVNIIGALAALALVGVLFLTFSQPKEQVATQTFGSIPAVNAPAANVVLPNGQLTPNPSTFDYLMARLYFYVDGALGFGNGTATPTNVQVVRMALTSGTSTPCALANPFTATSTVSNFSFNITTATSSAITWDIGTSTTAYATTTTMINAQAVAASAQSTITWDGSTNNTVISSGQYIVAGPDKATAAGTGAFTSVVLGGSCQATFTTAN